MKPEQLQGSDVLIVEDERDQRETLAALLEAKGYHIVTVTNGEEALEHLRHTALPRVILLDLMMPVMNGWSFRQEQQAAPLLAGIPVVVVSGEENLREKAAELQAAGYLTKPVKLELLLALLQRYCQSMPEESTGPADEEERSEVSEERCV